MKNDFLLLILLLLASCNHKQGNPNYNGTSRLEELTIDPDGGHELLLSSILKNIQYLPLGPSDELIGSVKKIIPFKEKYYLLDEKNNSIFIFYKEGKFFKQLKKIGKGPGEYHSITDFIIDKEKEAIEIYDRVAQKVLKYTLTGEFFDEAKVGILAEAFEKLGKDKYIFYDFHSKNSPYNLKIADLDGETYQRYFYSDDFGNVFRGLTHHFSKYNQGLSFLKWPGDTIYDVLSEDVVPKYHFNFTDDFSSEVHYFTENQDYFTFMFPYENKKAFTGFYCKKNKSLIISDRTINDINGIPFLKPIATDEDKFISVTSAFGFKTEFSKSYEELKDYVPRDMLKPTREFVEGIKENDNPILIVSTFKDF